MGFISMIGPCCGCHQAFSFNPVAVPSLRVNGIKEPVCASCLERFNKARIEAGLEPFPPPLPNAYTCCDENELN